MTKYQKNLVWGLVISFAVLIAIMLMPFGNGFQAFFLILIIPAAVLVVLITIVSILLSNHFKRDMPSVSVQEQQGSSRKLAKITAVAVIAAGIIYALAYVSFSLNR